jgi:hypothetical protein
VVPAFVAAEADYLILSRLCVDAQTAFVEDLASSYRLDSLDEAELMRAADICRRYRDVELGLADASIGARREVVYTHGGDLRPAPLPRRHAP